MYIRKPTHSPKTAQQRNETTSFCRCCVEKFSGKNVVRVDESMATTTVYYSSHKYIEVLQCGANQTNFIYNL